MLNFNAVGQINVELTTVSKNKEKQGSVDGKNSLDS